jgi:hypothetical protein
MQGQEIVAVLSKWIRFANNNSSEDNLAAFCPFHKGGNESSPALYVYVGPPTVHTQPGAAFCHACNEGWNLPRLLYKLGATPGYVDRVKKDIAVEKAHQIEVPRVDTVDFTQTTLPEEVLAVFDYCPRALVRAGFDPDLLRENDVGFDRDRRRITFGIRDHLGNLVGVSGRTVIDEEPRYKVYKSEFYDIAGRGYELKKSKCLWGLDKFYHTRLHLRCDEPVVVCEGFKAALWVKQAGFSDVVCLLGAALSYEQTFLLSRITDHAVLFLDNDAAGRKSTWKYAQQLKSIDRLRIVEYGTFARISPDDLSLEQVEEHVNRAPRALEWSVANGNRTRQYLVAGMETTPGGDR